MSQPRFDVLGLGNAIVDVIARCDEAFLASHDLAKGSMHLVSQDEAETLYGQMGPGMESSGGSAANTIAGIASLGGSAAFAGKVADDALGGVFAHDIRALGVHFDTAPLDSGAATGRCLVLVTPDGERTMNTFLGAAQELAPADIDTSVVADASMLYLEGYLWDPENAKQAFVAAAKAAQEAGRDVVLTLSDAFCVERYRDEFLDLIKQGTVDLVFANEHEVRSLYQTGDLATAMDHLGGQMREAVITRGAQGASIYKKGSRVDVPAAPVDQVVDLTGAGDLYAAGYLFARARGMSAPDCGKLGALCAAEVISHVGARPQADLKDLARQNGFAI
ncbi:adenosine kinase [Tepidamorphus sp. 3E244]|uniref:adenosine kinase n=1 Tax=Tepidamorphus sp. 3E244 TaxID=3385498 RepID=UPI0038FCD526